MCICFFHVRGFFFSFFLPRLFNTLSFCSFWYRQTETEGALARSLYEALERLEAPPRCFLDQYDLDSKFIQPGSGEMLQKNSGLFCFGYSHEILRMRSCLLVSGSLLLSRLRTMLAPLLPHLLASCPSSGVATAWAAGMQEAVTQSRLVVALVSERAFGIASQQSTWDSVLSQYEAAVQRRVPVLPIFVGQVGLLKLSSPVT